MVVFERHKAARGWQRLKDKRDAAEVEHLLEAGVSNDVHDPDGVRLEVLADPLGEMYGMKVW